VLFTVPQIWLELLEDTAEPQISAPRHFSSPETVPYPAFISVFYVHSGYVVVVAALLGY
jgi:hypothetical protein